MIIFVVNHTDITVTVREFDLKCKTLDAYYGKPDKWGVPLDKKIGIETLHKTPAQVRERARVSVDKAPYSKRAKFTQMRAIQYKLKGYQACPFCGTAYNRSKGIPCAEDCLNHAQGVLNAIP